MKRLDPHERARRLHAEAQQRYKAKLIKHGIPTHEIAMRHLGEAFGSIANTNAQIVNTGMKTLMRLVLVEALENLKSAGYDHEQSRQRLVRSLQNLSLEYVAKKAARGANDDSDSDGDADSANYAPST